MRISVVKEIKPQEERVGLTPANVSELVRSGHTVFVESGAGVSAGFEDAAYQEVGATMTDQDDAWAQADAFRPLP